MSKLIEFKWILAWLTDFEFIKELLFTFYNLGKENKKVSLFSDEEAKVEELPKPTVE